MSNDQIILASTSPRRRELIGALCVTFLVQSPLTDEQISHTDPARIVEALALRKAHDVASRNSIASNHSISSAIVGADTIVVLEDRVLGKPLDIVDARNMLQLLRGRTHHVVTGVAVVSGSRAAADHVVTSVTMRQYTDIEIQQSTVDGSTLDKSGGYSIQDEVLSPVQDHDGCECSVIGLPLWTLRHLLKVVANLNACEPNYDRCNDCPLRPNVDQF